MIRHAVKQNTDAWLLLRSGKPTASEFDNLVSAKKFEIKRGEGPKSYLAQKVAEYWLGAPLPSFEGSFAMEQGKIREEQAVPWYSWNYNVELDRAGFVTTDDGRIGASPDALIGSTSGLECKCPNAETHVKYLLAGELPSDYVMQVQGSMFVTGRNEWQFLSFRPHFPPFVLTVDRDEKIQAALAEALDNFLHDFDAAIKRLEEINGGPSENRDRTAEQIAAAIKKADDAEKAFYEKQNATAFVPDENIPLN